MHLMQIVHKEIMEVLTQWGNLRPCDAIMNMRGDAKWVNWPRPPLEEQANYPLFMKALAEGFKFRDTAMTPHGVVPTHMIGERICTVLMHNGIMVDNDEEIDQAIYEEASSGGYDYDSGDEEDGGHKQK